MKIVNHRVSFYDFLTSLQAQQYQGSYPLPYPTPPQDYSPVQTPTEESGRNWCIAATEAEMELKYPTPVSEPEYQTRAQEEPDFFVADLNPDRYWQKLMEKLQNYAQKWACDFEDFDDCIQRWMAEVGPPCLGWNRFWAVMCKLYKDARQLSAVHGSGVIHTAYTLMRENHCKKMCNIMKLVLLEL